MECKVVVVGDGAVGKSALTLYLIHNEYLEAYDPTIEDFYRKQIEVDGESVHLDILDTAGQEEFGTVRATYMRSGEAFVLVFSLTSASSLEEAKRLHSEVLKAKDFADPYSPLVISLKEGVCVGQERSYNVPFVLVGNKSDLEDQRQVSAEQAEAAAKQLGCPYIETSAKTGSNVAGAFARLVQEHARIAAAAASALKKKKKKKRRCLVL
eukprot:gnl/Hemi2/15031_TR5077_c0_g1_i1.p1 gnl/Hemi2/15031_TR5077_c0_g1~~gnl/Hemi2/15031_TR5077_c0_g1_i1.p1  ORF type:complete len:210 (+),score=50.22 gnl/Hemi2/15031_TR5077_c0_g1_i1:40-669(+)